MSVAPGAQAPFAQAQRDGRPKCFGDQYACCFKQLTDLEYRADCAATSKEEFCTLLECVFIQFQPKLVGISRSRFIGGNFDLLKLVIRLDRFNADDLA